MGSLVLEPRRVEAPAMAATPPAAAAAAAAALAVSDSIAFLVLMLFTALLSSFVFAALAAAALSRDAAVDRLLRGARAPVAGSLPALIPDVLVGDSVGF